MLRYFVQWSNGLILLDDFNVEDGYGNDDNERMELLMENETSTSSGATPDHP